MKWKFWKRSLSDRMKKEAVAHGLCRQWTQEWGKSNTTEDLLRKYVRGIDFVIRTGWPDNETLLLNSTPRVRHMCGIYIDENAVLYDIQRLVFNGRCEAELHYGLYDTADVYVRHDSDVKVVVEGNARVTVEVYDRARVYVINKGTARCFVYMHGGTVETKGTVTVRDKRGKEESK